MAKEVPALFGPPEKVLIFSYSTREVRIFLNPLSPNSCQKLPISFLHMMTTSRSSFTIFSKVPDVLSEEIKGGLYPPTACATISAKLLKVQSSSENVSVNPHTQTQSQPVDCRSVWLCHLDDDSTFDDSMVYSDCGGL